MKFEHRKTVELFYFTIFNVFKIFFSQFDRLLGKNDKYEEDGYKFNKMLKFSIKCNSNLSYRNFFYYFETPRPQCLWVFEIL